MHLDNCTVKKNANSIYFFRVCFASEPTRLLCLTFASLNGRWWIVSWVHSSINERTIMGCCHQLKMASHIVQRFSIRVCNAFKHMALSGQSVYIKEPTAINFQCDFFLFRCILTSSLICHGIDSDRGYCFFFSLIFIVFTLIKVWP